MSRVVAIGERVRVEGFGLAGAEVFVAEDAAAVRVAWAGLGSDVGVAVLTPAARAALGSSEDDLLEVVPDRPLLVVLPP